MASTIKVDTIQSTTSNVFFQNSAGTEYARFDSTGVFQLANPTTFPAGTALLPSITATGDTNTGLYFPAADTIGFTEGGVESMRITSAGLVGIGTGSPQANAKLQINGGGIASYWNNGNDGSQIYLGGTGFDNSSYYNSAPGIGSVLDSNTSTSGGLALYVYTGAANSRTPAIRLNANGNLALLGATVTTSGVGITFPATQVASSDANTLDDYEEGTWNPQHSDATNVTQSGICGYVKIGSFVYVNFDITVTKTTATLANFPFAGANLGGATNYPWYSGYNTAARTGSNAAGHMNNGSTSVNFYDGGNAYSLTVGMRVIGAMSYRT